MRLRVSGWLIERLRIVCFRERRPMIAARELVGFARTNHYPLLAAPLALAICSPHRRQSIQVLVYVCAGMNRSSVEENSASTNGVAVDRDQDYQQASSEPTNIFKRSNRVPLFHGTSDR